MFLYKLTLQNATEVVQAIHGNFSGSPQKEIVMLRGQLLELVKPLETGKLETLLVHKVHTFIRSMASFRPTGERKDYLILDCDPGRMVILQYSPTKNVMEKIHEDTYLKSGYRRLVPGQFLAVDPRGRAVMIGAVEKQKFLYIFKRGFPSHLTVSSPIEAPKSNTLLCNVVAVDVGCENPVFACLEIEKEEAVGDPSGETAQKTKQTLSYYELDLGLNQLFCKHSEPLEEHASLLIAVPGGNDGPSGILVCSKNYISYKKLGEKNVIRCPIPRRKNDFIRLERGVAFICSASYRIASTLVFLLLTEQGDIFAITLETGEVADVVTELKLKLFDTVPEATSMCMLNTSPVEYHLFVAVQSGDHCFYLFNPTDVDSSQPEWSSLMPLDVAEFYPRRRRYLRLTDQLESHSPLLACHIADFACEGTPQLYALCGFGPRSTLRVLRCGLEASEKYSCRLGGFPNGVWTLKRRTHDDHDAYVVVSFNNYTVVWSVDNTDEEVKDIGLLKTTRTLGCTTMRDGSYLQVYLEGIRYIPEGVPFVLWKPPANQKIISCALSQRQVIVSLAGGLLVYFEMDHTGRLELRKKKQLSFDIVCMAFANAPEDDELSEFVVVGTEENHAIIMSLMLGMCLDPFDLLELPATPTSLSIIKTHGSGRDAEALSTCYDLFVNIGLENGMLVQFAVDWLTGNRKSGVHKRNLGSKPVKLFRVKSKGRESILATSSRTWIAFFDQQHFCLAPVLFDRLAYASSLACKQCPEGVVAILTTPAGDTFLCFLALGHLSFAVNLEKYFLDYTPRKYVVDGSTSQMILLETDHHAYTMKRKLELREKIIEDFKIAASNCSRELIQELRNGASSEWSDLAAEAIEEAIEDRVNMMVTNHEDFFLQDLPESEYGAPKAGSGMWASVVRLLCLADGRCLHTIELPQNEAALSVEIATFADYPNDVFILVGVAKDLKLNPRKCCGGFIYTYKLKNESLVFVHKTHVDDAPYAVCAYRGRVLVGVGQHLRLYEMGERQLSTICVKRLTSIVANMQALGNRMYIIDYQEKTYLVQYKPEENTIDVTADDTYPRNVTTIAHLGRDIFAFADEYGNISVLRLGHPSNEGSDDNDSEDNELFWDQVKVSKDAGKKVEVLCSIHLREAVQSLQRATLIRGGSESLVYTTLSGAIGVLIPFTSTAEHDFLQALENHLREDGSPLYVRDHHSLYFQVKNVIDGDLCQKFNSLERSKQQSIAEELNSNPQKISKMLEGILCTQ